MEEIKKTYYSISEVCAKTELEPHVLRYWESEFSQLRPKKNRAGNRAYREKDIETIRYIKQLLYDEQYTIPGAKKKLAGIRNGSNNHHDTQLNLFSPSENGFKELAVKELREILNILQS
ncbi:MAG: MerR family transcriptional regulator [Chitinivibrionales bacterium]|nr:MerR family transcriptional regulator [Chitinivibrionales bacterium]